MKSVNLYLLTRQVAPDILSEYEYALSGREKSIKCRTEEIEMINAIVDQFFLCGAAPHAYDGWFYAFTIPQIGKEFDLLRISEDAVINIELKSQPVELRRVEKQLYQNRYYLGHLNKKIYSFTLIRDYGSMRVLSYDNGLKYSSFDEIIRKLGISIENMPPFRGDLKGIIEQYFHLINISLSDIPGSMGKDYGERCTKDYRLDAVLDIQEFTQIIIHCVLLYNNYHYMEYYSKTSQMRQLSVLPVPRDIWNYGLRYCNGAQTIVDVDSCRYLIFPKDTGSITEHGIQFNGRYYGCARGFAEKWFDCARIGGHTKVTVAYDPNDVRHLYIQADPGSSPEECHLLDGNKISSPFTVAEAEQMARADHEERVKHRPKEDTETARTSESIEKIVNAAKQKQPQSEKSKAQRIKEIKENRKAEINAQKPEPSTPAKNAAAKASAATVLQKDEMDPIQSILFEELNIVLGGENE